VIAEAGDVERAAFLAGGIETMRIQTGYAHCLPGRRRSLEAGVAAARSELGVNEFARWWTLGRQLAYDELVSAALDPALTRRVSATRGADSSPPVPHSHD
jgi:hypothetical protein